MEDLTDRYEKLYRSDLAYRGGFEETKAGIMRFQKIFYLLTKYLPESQFKNWRALDIGCATGELMNFLRPYFRSFAGVDIARSAIQQAKEKGFADVHQINIEHEKLPFQDDSFEFVFALEIIEHIFEADNFFHEIRRVLRPGGFLFVSTPNDILHWQKRIKILFGKLPFGAVLPHDENHIRFFSRTSFEKTVLQYGFSIVRAGGLPLSYRGTRLGVLGRFFAALSPDIFCSTYFLIAQK